MSESVNEAFKVPPELEAALRAKAASLVKAEPVDEAALLEQYVAEARAAQRALLRAKAQEIAAASDGPSLDGHGLPEEYCEIMIYKDRGKDALSYQPFGINGVFWKVQLGTKVVVPKVLRHLLDNTIGEVVTQFEGGLATTPVHRFPYQTIREDVPKAEYIRLRDAGRAAIASAALQS